MNDDEIFSVVFLVVSSYFVWLLFSKLINMLLLLEYNIFNQYIIFLGNKNPK